MLLLDALESLVVPLYLAILLCLALFGFHRSQLIFLYYRYKDRRPMPQGRFSDLPAVTVQLPLFNEMYVVERLLDAVVGIRYPRDRFQVQVLDDSTDETQDICKRKVAELRARFPELDIEYIHRLDRTGFKAGALENGLRSAKGELILIFDADFLPLPDMLERVVDHFVDPKVAMVQCRWKHLNRDFSALTEAQALLLDGHFVMEHAGRAWSNRFFNFNGTAGVWRRSAIAEAGGWQHDTLPEVAAPAELPVEMSAFKAQQFRWAKGSIQVSKKLLPTILRSNATRGQKSEAFFHLANNFAYPLLLLLSLLLLPNLVLRTKHGVWEVLMYDLPLFFGTTMSLAAFYLATQKEIARMEKPGEKPGFPWWALARLPLVLSLGIGLCVSQTRAVLEAVLGKDTEFVRTPKHGIRGKLESWSTKKYRAARSVTPLIELAMAGYYVVTMLVAFEKGHYLSMPFLALFLAGFAYVGGASLWQGNIGQAMRGSFRRRPVVAGAASTFLPVPAVSSAMVGAAPASMKLDDLTAQEWDGGPTMEMVPGQDSRSGLPA
jgi:Glycosyl transferase family 2